MKNIMMNEIKGLRPAQNISELIGSEKTLRAYARINDSDLIASIQSTCDAFNRVGTPNALALVVIADAALRSAQVINSARGKAERSRDLKDLAAWIGSVQLGWL